MHTVDIIDADDQSSVEATVFSVMSLCKGIGQTLRKDDSCDRTFAIYVNYLSMVWVNIKE